MMLIREVDFLKNRMISYIVFGVIGLAVIGLLSKIINNPAGLLQRDCNYTWSGAVIFFLVKRFL